MLLCRPQPFDGTETINDLDCFIANFWRALQAEPDEVARWCDWPVNEADLHARHHWLVNHTGEWRAKMHEDPDQYDVKIAGWWVWGLCQWIGGGWCEHPEWQQLPHLGDARMGVHRTSQQLPHLGDAGMGVHRTSQQLPHLGNAGRGVHRTSQQLPHLGNAGRGVHRTSQQRPYLGAGEPGTGFRGCLKPSHDIHEYFAALAARLRRVRVCCGDWSRVLGPTPTVRQGLTAVFLDPPYADEDRDPNLYAQESTMLAHDVRAWCLEHGDDSRLRIAFCGYEGEHDELESLGWKCLAWKARGGYGSQADHDNPNAKRERIWFSPHCLQRSEQTGYIPGLLA
jgi:hypothetical protein